MKTKLTKRILALLLTLVMVLSLLPAAFAEGNHHPFQDVPDGKWYSEAVQYVYENGLMNGTSSTTFDPSGKLTRAMLVTVLYRAAGQPAVEFTPKFSDVPAGRYYSVPVVWAVENGVTNGVSATKFNPNGAVTREQLAKFLYSYAKLMSFEAAARADLSVFPDAAEAHSWAVEPLQWAVAEGIINGVLTGSGETAKTLLQPRATATRAQVAVMLMRFFQTHTAPDLGEDAVILYTNDVHTYIDKALGYDNIAGLKKAIARTNDVILVDAGDHIQGTAFGSMDKGKTIVDLMNAADYDLATLGNHEFDYTMEGCMNTIEWANFPYVSCNFYHEENGVRGENVLDAYKVFELGGRKVALIGITTPESFTKSTPAYFQDENGNYIYGISGGEDGSALYADVQAAIDAAKAEADVVIALGHLGIDPSSSPWTSKELIANTTGLDAFIDGHSHSTVEQEIVKDQAGSDVVLTQTGCYFGAIGMMRIAPDGTISTELITECEYSDPAVKEIQDNWIDEINGRLGEVIGHTALTFDNYDETGRLVRKMETNTGDFTADALYYLFDSLDYDVDVAFMNGGGVRNRAVTGDISYLSCKNIHTFGNVACLQTVTGQQILDALEWGARSTDAAECGGFLQVSGLKYKVDPTIPDTTQKDDKGVWTGGPTGEYRVYDVEVFQDGEWVDLDLDAEYNLAGYNYTLRYLGDGFNMFNGAVNVIDYVMEDYMVLANYVKAFPIPEGATLPEIEGTNSPLVEKFGTDYLDYTNVAPGLRIQIAEKQTPPDDSDEDLYVLTSELHNHEQIVVYHPASGMALSNADLSETQTGYRAGVAVTPENNCIKNPDAAIVWTVEATENGWYLKDAEGRKLSIPSGSRGLVLDGADPEWAISAAGVENCVNLKSTTRSGSSGDPLAVEWFSRYSEFTVYFLNASSNDFALQLYVKTEQTGPVEPIGVDFAILSTTDVHGKVWDTNILTDGTEYNSLLSIKTAANEVRAELGAENVLLIDNGDLYQGNPVSTVQLSKITSGESDWPAVMALALADMEYTAAALGNHEWNYPYATMEGVRTYLAGNGVPTLCANLYYEDGTNAYTPYIIREIVIGDQTLKIGVLGLENTDCTRWDVPDNYPGIVFHHPDNTEASIAWEANRYIPMMQADGADFIVVAYHGGKGSVSGDLSFGINTENQGARLIAETTGIDMVIMGHDHSSAYSNTFLKNLDGEDVLVVNAGGQDLTKSVFTATLDYGEITVALKSTENLKMSKKVDGQKVFAYEPDAGLKAKVQPYVDLAVAYVNEPIGKAIGEWDTGNNYYLEQCDTMDFIQDAQMYEGTKYLAEKYDTQEKLDALYAATGLDHLEVDMSSTSVATNPNGYYVQAGDLTMKDIFKLYKYDNNTLYLLPLTGQQIKDILEQNASTRLASTVNAGEVIYSQFGDFYTNPVTGGLNFTYDMYQPEGSRVVIEGFANGREFALDKTYIVAVNSYHLGNLGCGFGNYATSDAIWSQLDDLGGGSVPELLAQYTKDKTAEQGGVNPADFTWHWALTYTGPLDEPIEITGDVLGQRTDAFHDGAKLLIYYPAGSTVVGLNKAGDTNRLEAVDAVCDGERVGTSTAAAIFEVKLEDTENGYYSLKSAEGYLTSGDTGNSLVYSQELTDCGLWYLTAVENGFHVMNVGAAYNDNHNQALEYYNGFTTYGVKNTDAYLFQLYELIESTEPEDIIIGGLEANVWTTKYGNIYTSCTAERLQEMGFAYGDIITVKFLDQILDLPLVPTFSYVDQGTPGLFINKSETGEFEGNLFMAINMGDFTTTYGIATKTTNPDKTWYWTACEGVTFPIVVTLEMKEQGGYATEMAIRDINRTNNREDYPDLTDAEFANFRQITTTGMGDHLYRGSSPINPEIGRNTYADAALADAGVTVIMNLANDQATAEAYEGFADTYYSKQNVVYLNLGVDFTAADFQSGLATGLRHFAENKGVYYVHCTEGKDRAGFVSALLECLMGATYDEVVADYLKTYTNYYTVVDGVQQPLSQETLDAIANSNIIKTLQTAFEVEDLTTADLAAEAAEYVKAIGLTDDELAALKENLGESRKLKLVEDANDMLKYGHLVIDVSTEDLLKQFAYGDIVTVTVEGYGAVDAPICSNYDDVDTGETLIRAKSGKTNVNLAINYGQIGVQLGIIETAPEGSATKYQVKEGVTFPIYVTIEMKEAGGYADELAIRAMTRDDNHDNRAAAYPDLTDAEYANFRVVTTTGMGEDALYRSSSPINPEIGRNAEADAAAQAAGIKAFMNMADTQAEAEAYAGYADTYYAGQNKIFLGLPVAFTTDEFKTGLADGYRFIASNDGPYLIHCTEGKDRTGLGVAVLEALMGASIEEIKTDYLQTYINYYNVVDGVQQPLTDAQKAAVTNTIVNNLGIIFDTDVSTASLADEAEAYLTEIGLTADEQAALKVNLGKSWSSTGPEEPTASYEVAESVSAGDRIIMVYTVGEKFYAMSNDNSTAGMLKVSEVTFTDGVLNTPDAGTIFTLETGSADGSFLLKGADGKYIFRASGSTAVNMQETGADWTLTLGEGASRIAFATDASRCLFIRDNNPLQIRCYSTQNLTASGYYSTATIYKVVNP